MAISTKKDWTCDICGKQTSVSDDKRPTNWVNNASITIKFYRDYSEKHDVYFDFCDECADRLCMRIGSHEIKPEELKRPFWKKLLGIEPTHTGSKSGADKT